MSAEARYFRVGLFVFLGASAIVAGVIVLGGRGFLSEPIVFETVFNESVQGLEVGSPVNFRGVKIGQVAEIGFVDDYYPTKDLIDRLRYAERILVRFEARTEDLPQRVDDLDRMRTLEALVEQGLRLRLTTQGITGLSFVEADIVDPEKNPPLNIYWEPEHLYVPSAPSTISRLTSAAERIFSRLEDVNVEQLVMNLDGLIVSLDGLVESFDAARLTEESLALFREARQSMRSLRADLERADVPALGSELRETLDEGKATMARLRQTLDGSRYDFELALENLRVASENLRDLTETLRSQPSLLLRSNAPEDGGTTP